MSTPASASAGWSNVSSPRTFLIDELDSLAQVRGNSAVLRCDNGPELACDALANWADERVGLSFIPPDENWRNGYVVSFYGRVRDECLNINLLWSLIQARVVISDWKEDNYNQRRGHSCLGYKVPADTLPPASTDNLTLTNVDHSSGSGQWVVVGVTSTTMLRSLTVTSPYRRAKAADPLSKRLHAPVPSQ